MIAQSPPKRRIAAAFSAKARSYRAGAHIQKEILRLLVPIVVESGRFDAPWLDAGCGAGDLARLLEDKNVRLKIINADLAFGTLRLHKGISSVQSDIEALPFASGVFGGVVAASVLHWLADFSSGVGEIARVLAPGGTLVFSAFTAGSFSELSSLRQERNLAAPVLFPIPDEVLCALGISGFRVVETKTFEGKYFFNTALNALRYLSGTGSTAVRGSRLSRSGILSLCADYEARYGGANGVSLTVNAVYGAAVKG